MIGIYKIENLINGKIYIGQSTNIKKRWREHKQIPFRQSNSAQGPKQFPLYQAFLKYGLENFDFSIIEECTIDKLDEREIYWISYYNSYIKDGNKGYNLTRGGDGHKSLPTNIIEQIKKFWKQGYTTGEIEKLINKDKHIVIKYLKLYEPSYSIEESNNRAIIQSGIKHRKSIVQYDYLGRYIKKYNSAREASKELGIPAAAISRSALKRQKGTNKYYFITFKPVIQLDLKDNYIACYIDTNEAFLNTNVPQASIRTCASGKSLTAYGYRWKYLEYDDIKKYNIN